MSITHKNMTTERISNLLEQVGELDGIKGLRLNSEGAAKLRLNGDKEIFFEYSPDSGMLFVYKALFVLPSDPAKRAALMQGLLSSSFLKDQSTLGGWAVDWNSDAVVYQIWIDSSNLTVEKLDRYIDIVVKQEARMTDFTDYGNSSFRPASSYKERAGVTIQRRLLSLCSS